MPLFEYSVSIGVDDLSCTQEVTAFIGTTPYSSSEYRLRCPDHYLLTLPITRRPPSAWATFSEPQHQAAMGEVMLVPPGFVQCGSFRPQNGSRKDVFCLFPQSRFEHLMGGAIDWTDTRLRETMNVRDANIRAAARRLSREVISPGLASSVVRDSLAAVLAIDIQRCFGGRNVDEAPTGHVLSQRQLDQIDEYIHAHTDREFHLNDFAELCGMSVRHLSRVFRNSTGITLAHHVAEIRVAIAQDLLSETNIPIKVVAGKVGFSNVSSFTTAFRKLAGTTPGAFRRLAH
jgi:AraC family transcriptional regulator